MSCLGFRVYFVLGSFKCALRVLKELYQGPGSFQGSSQGKVRWATVDILKLASRYDRAGVSHLMVMVQILVPEPETLNPKP